MSYELHETHQPRQYFQGQRYTQAPQFDEGPHPLPYESGLHTLPYESGLHVVPGPKIDQPYYAGPPVDPNWQHPSYMTQTTAQPTKEKIFGLRKSTFWVIVIIIILVIGAVGGGVGGSIAAKSSSSSSVSSSSSSSSPSPTSSTSSSITSSSTSSSTSATVTDEAGCPAVNEQIYSSTAGLKFKKLCYTDLIGINQISPDIMKYSQVSTFEACIDYCATYNTETHPQPCVGIAYDLYTSGYRDCWLKNTTGILNAKNDPASVVHAALAL